MASSLKSSKSEEKRDEESSKDKSDQVEIDGEEEESPETSEKSSEDEEVEKLDSEDAAVVSEKILQYSVKEREKGTEDKKAEERVKEGAKEVEEENENTDSKEKEINSVESKLEAEALSASLSSSRCLLKRNRDDLDVDSDGDTPEEPDCKKSHKAAASGNSDEEEEEEVTPVVVEKSRLSKAELVASMSSSKSVLKRSIDQVTESAESSAAPELKKSNIVSQETEESRQDESSKGESSDGPRSLVNTSRPVSGVSPLHIPSSQKLLSPSSSSPPTSSKSPLPVLQSTSLSPLKGPNSAQDVREQVKQSPKVPKEEVRVIAARDLAEDRKLEKRRLNKMLTIFDDQKPIK